MRKSQYTTSFSPDAGEAFFGVVRSRTINANLNKSYIRHSINHPGGSGVVPLVGNDVLFVEQYRPAVQDTVLEIPAGRSRANEIPMETAHRELQEEVGILADHLIPLGAIYASPCFSNLKVYLFLAMDLHLADRPPIEETDEIPLSTRRVRIDEIDEMVSAGEIVDAKTITALYLARIYLQKR